MLNYIERDAARIRNCLPGGTALPEGADELFRIYAVLLRTKGAETSISDVHDAWSAWMSGKEPEHDSIRPFNKLDEVTQAEDQPFLVAIKKAATSARDER